MSVATIQFFSEGIGQRTSYTALLPRVGDGPFPVLLQLHGLSDDHHSWMQRSNLDRYAENLPMIIVLPNGGTSGYLNWKGAGRLQRAHYEDMIMQDIVKDVKRVFNVREGKWAIGGLSMGGYGAMRFGLKYHEQFGSIYAHSSAFHIGEMVTGKLKLPNLVDMPVDLIEPESRDTAICSELADAVAKLDDRPVITFDCGVDDELLPYNQALHQHMNTIGLDHTYLEFPGAHTWDYWDVHVREALQQHCTYFGIEPIDPASSRDVRG